MKCSKCGFENNDKAKFCTKCGEKLDSNKTVTQSTTESSGSSKNIIVVLVIIIVILVAAIGFFALNWNSHSVSNDASTSASDKAADSSNANSGQSSQATSSKSKSWELIGSYSGSGTGSKTVTVPEGRIKVELSSFPIKNYADNHLHVKGSNGASGGVDWGPTSAVETRSDSFEFTSSSSQTFTIDYYETVSWEVEFYRYQ
ncbi:zinc ribbon domain-containing protein [uncultured Methanobrevibacter sp.]|uniref:zinc ribbon domain-containing protein n=1 Tax=uncultured Methanobrevibacter sp. TaxID=253161 RepID=UPI0025D9A2CA|nr:zinc ribbon domain-containing protein [uncultured Methanobrevibacter sp.]